MCGRHGRRARGLRFACEAERVFKKEPVRLDGRGDGLRLRMRVVALKVQASFGFALRTRAAFLASVGGAARRIKREGLDERDAVASSAIC